MCFSFHSPSHSPTLCPGIVITEEASKRSYDEVLDITKLISRMEEYLLDHNAMSKRPMNLAVFLYAVEHISRIARVLKQPGVGWGRFR